jgi:inosose dehydratase
MSLIGSHSAPWWQHYQPHGAPGSDHWSRLLTDMASAGLKVVEPVLHDESEIRSLHSLLTPLGMSVASISVHCDLTGRDWEDSANRALALATAANPILNCRLLVVRPRDPAAPTDAIHDDSMLTHQAAALRWLTNRLDRRGIVLAYQPEEASMACGARELHHLMMATRNVGMRLCLDVHRLFRGCGNSQLAVQDLITLYGDRVGTVRLRQSRAGIWTEYLADGDIDYQALIKQLTRYDFSGPFQLETLREHGTPTTVSLVESHRRSLRFLQDLLRRTVPST